MRPSKSSNPDIAWPLLDRYYAGDATPDEQQQVEQYFARFPERAKVTRELASTVQAMTPSDVNVTNMLTAAHRRMTASHTTSQLALKNIVHAYFGGSIQRAVAALLDMADTQLSDTDMIELRHSIQRAEEEGR